MSGAEPTTCGVDGGGCARCPKRVVAWLWVLYLGFAVPMILAGFEIPGTRLDNDQNRFHLLVVEQFMAQWPTLDYSDYASATTPGYHTVVAAAGLVFGDSVAVLRGVGACFTLGLLAWWGASLGKRLRWPESFAVAAPLLTSLYVFPSGVWLLPDNAAWWGVLGMLGLAWWGDWRRAWTYVAAALILAALVYVRQAHLWVAGAVVVSAWFGVSGEAEPGVEEAEHDGGGTWLPNARRFVLAGVSTLPAVVLLGWFFWMWGAATPPTFAQQDDPELGVQGYNLAVPATVLAVASYVGVVFVGYWGPVAWQHLKTDQRNWGWVAAAVLLALLAGLLPETTKNVDAHRFGGIWGIANLAVVSGRSLTFTAAAVVGAVSLASAMIALPTRQRWVLLTALAGFTSAMSVNAWALPRYYEPLMIMLFALSAVTLRSAAEQPGNEQGAVAWSRAWWGPAVLAVLFAALTVFKLT